MMRLKLLYLIIFLVVSVSSARAVTITAEGYGETEAESRANAVAEMSFIIYSDVKSELHIEMDSEKSSEQQYVKKQIDITSALPVMSAVYKTEQISSDFKTTVSLKSEDALPVYIREIETVLASVNNSYKSYSGETSSSGKYFFLMKALAGFENLRKLKAVVNVLGGNSPGFPDVALRELQAAKESLASRSDDMTHAASLIASELKAEDVFVYYPMTKGSDEVTQFASVFKDILASKVDSVSSLFEAEQYLHMDYTVSEKGIFLSAALTDRDAVTLAKSTKLLEPAAYKGLKVNPESISFEKLLKLGTAKSDEFSVRITTKHGKRAMLYRAGETVELFVKLNKPGFFFLVGHVDKDGEKFSYLVDFYPAVDNRKFIRRVEADEINRWLSLGEFDIVPPFGLETFQLVAAIKNPVDMIPSYVFDPDTELFIVSKDIKEGVRKTRAIKKKPENRDKIAEDILVFSTIDK